MDKDMFIIKGKDFTIKSSEIVLNYWEYFECDSDDNDNVDFKVEHVTSFEELQEIFNNFDIDDITITDNFYKFKIESYNKNTICILCDECELKDILDCIDEDYEHVEHKFNLKTIHKSLKFSEFKTMFNLKGTKKQLIHNTPEGYELNFLTLNWNTRIKYTLSKTIEENCNYIEYYCCLGSYKINEI